MNGRKTGELNRQDAKGNLMDEWKKDGGIEPPRRQERQERKKEREKTELKRE
jgi:hypothetical protein